jgi:hypothetical protein
MASCKPFTVTVAGDVAAALDKARQQITAKGGTFGGDANAGTVSLKIPILGTVRGEYAVSGQDLTITITDRPFLAPCGTIEERIRQFFQ